MENDHGIGLILGFLRKIGFIISVIVPEAAIELDFSKIDFVDRFDDLGFDHPDIVGIACKVPAERQQKGAIKFFLS